MSRAAGKFDTIFGTFEHHKALMNNALYLLIMSRLGSEASGWGGGAASPSRVRPPFTLITDTITV